MHRIFQKPVSWFYRAWALLITQWSADDIDVDDVHAVYRVVLVQILALSYAVRLPTGYPTGKTELMA